MMRRSIIVTLVLVAFAWSCAAQEVAPAPAAEAATSQPAQSMTVTVVSVSGLAETLQADRGEQWTELKAGEELNELAVIRTGFRARVVLRFQDRGEVVIDRATKVGVAEFRKEGELVRTRLGLKYGAMRATVDSSRGPNDVKVSTPVATLSVRGTQGDIGYSGDRGLGLRGHEGTWRVAVGERTRGVQAGEVTNSNLTPSIEIVKRDRESVLGDVSGGLTGAELDTLVNNPSPTNPTSPGNSQNSGPNMFQTTVPLPEDHVTPGI